MIRDIFEVPDVEHPGDIEYFKGIIQDAGGTVTGYSWSGYDGDSCYIFYCFVKRLLDVCAYFCVIYERVEHACIFLTAC